MISPIRLGTLWLLLTSVAQAASDPREYPWMASIHIPDPAGAPVRVDLSAEWVARCPDATSYLLLDADGQEVPFATFTSDGSAWGGDTPRRRDLRWAPDEDKDGAYYRVSAITGALPAQALWVGLPRSAVARVQVRDLGLAEEPVAERMLWNLPSTSAGTELEFPLPWSPSSGPWEVRIRRRTALPLFSRWPHPQLEAILSQPDAVSEVQLPVSLEGPIPQDAVTSQWSLLLPRGDLPVRALELEIQDPLFSRPVTLGSASLDGGRGRELGSGLLERFERGDFALDSAALVLAGDAPRALVLTVDDGRSAPLRISGANIHLRGAALWLPHVQPGEQTLYGCGPAGADYDIDRAAQRHGAWTGDHISPEPPTVNPTWHQRLLSSQVALGPPPGPVDFQRVRDVDAEAGLARLELDADILSVARDDLGDLRLLDPQDRQLAYLLERHPLGHLWSPPAADWQVQGSFSRFKVTLPAASLRARALVLTSERGRFQRRVLLRPAVPAGHDEPAPLLETGWEAEGDGPSRLVLPLDRRLPAQIWVDVDHGDNAPIPLQPPSLVLPAATLWAVIPADVPFRLLYGAASLVAPRYDLAFLREQLLEAPASDASLGPVRTLEPAEKPVNDRLLVGAAIALLALALLVLIARLAVRGDEDGASDPGRPTGTQP